MPQASHRSKSKHSGQWKRTAVTISRSQPLQVWANAGMCGLCRRCKIEADECLARRKVSNCAEGREQQCETIMWCTSQLNTSTRHYLEVVALAHSQEAMPVVEKVAADAVAASGFSLRLRACSHGARHGGGRVCSASLGAAKRRKVDNHVLVARLTQPGAHLLQHLGVALLGRQRGPHLWRQLKAHLFVLAKPTRRLWWWWWCRWCSGHRRSCHRLGLRRRRSSSSSSDRHGRRRDAAARAWDC